MRWVLFFRHHGCADLGASEGKERLFDDASPPELNGSHGGPALLVAAGIEPGFAAAQ
jgi:hypothetical protein